MSLNIPWQQEASRKISKAIAKAWLDPEGFGKRLMENPKGVLEEEEGVFFPSGITIQINRNTAPYETQGETSFPILLPPKPDVLSTEDLIPWVNKKMDCGPPWPPGCACC